MIIMIPFVLIFIAWHSWILIIENPFEIRLKLLIIVDLLAFMFAFLSICIMQENIIEDIVKNILIGIAVALPGFFNVVSADHPVTMLLGSFSVFLFFGSCNATLANIIIREDYN